jgi:hypothetical protein
MLLNSNQISEYIIESEFSKRAQIGIDLSVFKVEQVNFRGYGEIRWRFDIQFVSKDPVDEKSLKSSYNEYQLRTKFTPEFKEGLKKIK